MPAIPLGSNGYGPYYATTNTASGQYGFDSPQVYSPNNSLPVIDPLPLGPGGEPA